MADPYGRHAASTDRHPQAAFPGYLPPHYSAFASQQLQSANNLWGPLPEFPQNGVLPIHPGGYTPDDLEAIGSCTRPGIVGLTPGPSMRASAPLDDPVLVRDAAVGIKPGLTNLERSDPLRKSAGLPADESNILYVDGLPTDCTRREVAHLFRPFIGFKEIRVVHKEPRRTSDRAHVLCFVEFNDAKCALTALEALQGYKFDDKKPDAPVLRIQFAKFPFRTPYRDDRG